MDEIEPDILRSRFRGCLIGAAMGDAVGEMAFRCDGKDQLEDLISSAGILGYTDDTAMTIGLAESILEEKRIDAEKVGKTFHRNYEREPWRGYAGGPPWVFSRVASRGGSYREAAKALYSGEGSFGNGAAMRAAPVGLFYGNPSHQENKTSQDAETLEDLYEIARESAAATHAHPVGIDGAAAIARAVSFVLQRKPGESGPHMREDLITSISSFVKTPVMKERMNQIAELFKTGESEDKAGFLLGSGGAAQDSVPFAVYVFLKHPDSFKDCLFTAAFYSADRDTVACMASAISGAFLGVEAIPGEWQKKLEDSITIAELADSLLAL